MNRFKAVFTILGLLAIGFTGGFFTHRYVTIRHINKVASMRNPRDFQLRLLDAIEANDTQRTVLMPIVESYAGRISEGYCQFWHYRRELVDSLYGEMRPHLSQAQIRHMEEFSQRYRKERRSKSGNNCNEIGNRKPDSVR